MTKRGLKNINVFYSTFTNVFFLIFVTFFTFLTFFIFFWNVFYIYAYGGRDACDCVSVFSAYTSVGRPGMIQRGVTDVESDENRRARSQQPARRCSKLETDVEDTAAVFFSFKYNFSFSFTLTF